MRARAGEGDGEPMPFQTLTRERCVDNTGTVSHRWLSPRLPGRVNRVQLPRGGLARVVVCAHDNEKVLPGEAFGSPLALPSSLKLLLHEEQCTQYLVRGTGQS